MCVSLCNSLLFSVIFSVLLMVLLVYSPVLCNMLLYCNSDWSVSMSCSAGSCGTGEEEEGLE